MLDRIRLTGVAAAAMSLLAAGKLRAQDCERCGFTEDSAHARVRVLPAVGLRVGSPQKASLALGVVSRAEWQDDGRDYSRNLVAFIEPGITAARGSLGWIQGIGNMGSGLGAAATVLRTWNTPWTLPSNGTFVGGELFVLPIFLVGPRAGLFKQVSGGSDMKRWYFTIDFGFGV